MPSTARRRVEATRGAGHPTWRAASAPAGSSTCSRDSSAIEGRPATLRSDNGPEFVSCAILRWTTAEGIETAHIAPGKPPGRTAPTRALTAAFARSASAWSGFGTRRGESAAAIIETWRRHYNEAPTALKSRLFDTDRVQRETRGNQQPDLERLLSSFDWSEEPSAGQDSLRPAQAQRGRLGTPPRRSISTLAVREGGVLIPAFPRVGSGANGSAPNTVIRAAEGATPCAALRCLPPNHCSKRVKLAIGLLQQTEDIAEPAAFLYGLLGEPPVTRPSSAVGCWRSRMRLCAIGRSDQLSGDGFAFFCG